jgi:hypothetical protein
VFEQWPRGRRAALVIALLVVENVMFFHAHYRGTVVFPYDFGETYHAVPFYWQGAVRAGHFPHWLPYQAFGYPIALNLQSGLFYPPLWAFPIVGATYSLRAAAILQGLHVLAGGLGAFVFARARKLAFITALIAALAYSAFGGFFCNAQHVDIVRGYALLPWLFWALTLDQPDRRWRAWSVAPMIFLFTTGAYPGQWIAALVFGGGYLALQLGEVRLAARAIELRPVISRAAAMVLGLGLSAISVLPGFALRGEISRVDEVGKMTVTGLGFDHLFTTVFPYDAPRLSGDISMRSLFITVPLLFGLFLLRRADLRRHAALCGVALLAFAMANGGAVFALVARLVPPLGYSRFPAADYRALIALPAIVLGAQGLASITEARARLWLALAAAVFAGFVFVGAVRLHPDHMLGVAIMAAILIALAFARHPIALALIVPIVLFDAHRMHTAVIEPWSTPNTQLPYKRYASELMTELDTPRTERPLRAPARFEVEHGGPDLDGYLRGRYTSDDYAASEHFRAVEAIRASPALSSYLVAASSPRILPMWARYTGTTLATTGQPTGTARSIAFDPDQITYEVTAPSDSILVENEPSFEGWRGCENGEAPLRELWPLRAWLVPAGTHRFCARFDTPKLRLAAAISIASVIAWLAWAVAIVRRRRYS